MASRLALLLLAAACVALLGATPALADTPANCTYAQYLGTWSYSTGPLSPPGTTADCSSFKPPAKPVSQSTIKLAYPNVAVDDMGNTGNWTLVYNQGVEVWIGGRIWFAFSAFTSAGASVCSSTSAGWVHGMQGEQWACFVGQQTSQDPLPLELLEAAPSHSTEQPTADEAEAEAAAALPVAEAESSGPSPSELSVTFFADSACSSSATGSFIVSQAACLAPPAPMNASFQSMALKFVASTNEYTLSLFGNPRCEGAAPDLYIAGRGLQCQQGEPMGQTWNFRLESEIIAPFQVLQYEEGSNCDGDVSNAFGSGPLGSCIASIAAGQGSSIFTVDPTGAYEQQLFTSQDCSGDGQVWAGQVMECNNDMLVVPTKQAASEAAVPAEAEAEAEDADSAVAASPSASGPVLLVFAPDDVFCTGHIQASIPFSSSECMSPAPARFGSQYASAQWTFDASSNIYSMSLYNELNCTGAEVTYFGQGFMCQPGISVRVQSAITAAYTYSYYADTDCAAGLQNSYGVTPDACVVPMDPTQKAYQWRVSGDDSWTLQHFNDAQCMQPSSSQSGQLGMCFHNAVLLPTQPTPTPVPPAAAPDSQVPVAQAQAKPERIVLREDSPAASGSSARLHARLGRAKQAIAVAAAPAAAATTTTPVAAAPASPARREALRLSQPYRVNQRFLDEVNAAQSLFTVRAYPEWEGRSLGEHERRRGTRLPMHLADAMPPRTQTQMLGDEVAARAPRKDIPAAFDWRNVSGVNYVSPVRNQGSCGSCFAFSSAGMLESRIRVASHNAKQPILSPQDVVSCSAYSQGCEGGFPYLVAGKYARDFGMAEEACYPYAGADSDCSPNPQPGCNQQRWRSKEYYYVGGYYGASTAELMQEEILANGPISVSFEVYDDFDNYAGGVYTHQFTKHLRDDFNPFELVNHAVLMVGWGETTDSPPVPYWIVKNSWSESWGENGYFRILRGSSEAGGECAIESLTVAAIPVLH